MTKGNNNRPHYYITDKVKLGAFEGVMSQVRKELKKPLSTASKIIHNGFIDSVSSFIAITLARPRSILGASLFMLVTGILLIAISREYGFYLPPSLLIFLYMLGYLISIVVELALGIIKKRY